MHLAATRISPSPQFTGFARASATIDRRDGASPLEVWFDVPDESAQDLAQSHETWLLAMLPYALETGEGIDGELTVDGVFLENLRGAMAVWRSWYPELKPVSISVQPMDPARAHAGVCTATFFSGGIDSWFTALRYTPELEASAIGDSQDLICVHGFDIPLSKPSEFDALSQALGRAAAKLGKRFVPVRTNLRQPGSLWATAWGRLTHGAALAAVCHLLAGRYAHGVIGSTFHYSELFPWGSHPMVDPLLSSRTLRLTHDHAGYDRVEKTRLVAGHPDLLPYVHVCYANGDERNCGRCSKCVRTQSTLRLLRSEAVDGIFDSPFSWRKVSGTYLDDEVGERFMGEVLRLAQCEGDGEAQQAIMHCIRVSRRLRPWVALLKRLGRLPGGWRLEATLGRWLANRSASS